MGSSTDNSQFNIPLKIKKFFLKISRPIFEHSSAFQAISNFTLSVFTFLMVLGTFCMAIQTKKQAYFTARYTEYSLKREGKFSLKLTLGIKIDRNKVHPVIGQERMPVFVGSEFKKYSEFFDFIIKVENQSPVRLREKFDVYMILKKKDEKNDEWNQIGNEYRVLTCEGLGPEDSQEYKNIRTAILNSGVLSVNINDNSKIMITLYPEFEKKEDFFIPKYEVFPELSNY